MVKEERQAMPRIRGMISPDSLASEMKHWDGTIIRSGKAILVNQHGHSDDALPAWMPARGANLTVTEDIQKKHHPRSAVTSTATLFRTDGARPPARMYRS